MLGIVPLLASASFASEIQVQASRPVVVAIDGQPAGVAGTLVDTRDLAAGTHRVQVRNFVGSLLAEGQVELQQDERLRLLYDRERRVILEIDRVPLSSPPPPAPAPAPDAASVPSDGSPTPTPDARVQLTDSPTGSLVITGLSDLSGFAEAGGTALSFDPDAGGFVATGLSPPSVVVRVLDNGAHRHEGPVDVVAGGERTCALLYRQTAWVLDCATTGPERQARPPAPPVEPG